MDDDTITFLIVIIISGFFFSNRADNVIFSNSVITAMHLSMSYNEINLY